VTPSPQEADVVVVGAGISGLCAAYRLHQRGLAVAVLEASSRIGGRTLNLDIGNDEVVDAGAQWIGPQQTRVLALCDELGIETFPTYVDGAMVLVRNGRRVIDHKGTYGLTFRSQLDFLQAQRRLDRMVRSLPAQDVWDHPRAHRWDATTFAQWMRRNCRTVGARSVFDLIVKASFGCFPSELSLLGVLVHIRSAGDLDTLVGVEGAALERRVEGGTARIAAELAAHLTNLIHLDTPVSEVAQYDGERVVVRTEGGDWRAGSVVIAVDATAATRIAVTPTDPRRHMLQQRWRQGSGVKAFATYSEPWWREQGLNGMGAVEGGSTVFVFDATPRGGTPGVLGAALAPHDPPPHSRCAAVVEDLVKLFGKRASQYEKYVEQDWSTEPWIGGCLAGLPTGAITTARIDRSARQGHVHWAGSEASSVWESHMDGAVRAAERVVDEIMV